MIDDSDTDRLPFRLYVNIRDNFAIQVFHLITPSNCCL